MNLLETVKSAVTMKQAAEHYGCRVNRVDMIRCPFHVVAASCFRAGAKTHSFCCGSSSQHEAEQKEVDPVAG